MRFFNDTGKVLRYKPVINNSPKELQKVIDLKPCETLDWNSDGKEWFIKVWKDAVLIMEDKSEIQ